MQTVIAGAGPTGLFLSIALARRGHEVTVLDRDPGPAGPFEWQRRGVMQFHHPHGFRQQVGEALQAEMPEVWDAMFAAGAIPIPRPDRADIIVGIHCRRMVFERVLRSAALTEPGVTLRACHADAIESRAGKVTGVRADGALAEADLVIDASGRAGRLSRHYRAPAESSDCGLSYASRQYRLLDGAEDGPVNSPVGLVLTYPGYLAIVFLQDNRTISVLVARGSDDRELAAIRSAAAFEAALNAIPGLAAWTDPRRSAPITPVLPGGRLYNRYQGQLGESGRIEADGLICVGDSVCTTNPTAGRGMATSLMQAQHLAGLIGPRPGDVAAVAEEFGAWCDEHIRPWYLDHVDWDTQLARRWAGAGIDVTRPLPSDLIVAATEVDPGLFRAVGPYLQMIAPPSVLSTVEPEARAIYAGGWRPPVPEGPSRDELAALVAAAG
jgi:2-polyprenyl-6-methoxyphenol hydroxylase-like FAD-dependent oxidoreductase